MSGEKHNYKYLFTTHNIGNIEIKNRLVFLSHWPGYSRDGLPTETTMRYYAERAKGGVGLVIIESQSAHPEGFMTPGFIAAYEKKSVKHLKLLTGMIHENGARVFGQLTHQGHTSLMVPPQLLSAPTQMPEPFCHFNTKELDLGEIQDIIEHFALSAKYQKESGFDGIEIKIGHDGLLRSFVSPFFNRRKDKYGGSYKKRVRMPLEVIQAVRNAVGNDYPVGVRLCLDEFTPWGYTLDYGVKLAKTFEDAGIDFLTTDCGTFSSFYMEIPPMVVPLGFAIYMGAELKKVLRIPIIAFGRINDPVQAETILAEGNADFIGMCRQLACDPETPVKAFEGRLDDIRHCIACNDGCMFQVKQEKPLHCVQNPATGREKEMGIDTIKPAVHKKRVTVVGGGIAGMKAAEICAARGHSVRLYEKCDRLGGQLLLAEKLPYRIEVSEVSRYLIFQLEKHKVDVVMNKKVNEADIVSEDSDVIIIATGSKPFIPAIEGSRDSNVEIIDAREALRDRDFCGKRVVVMEKIGHWQGAGICEYVLNMGASTYAVTPNWQIGIDLELGNNFLLHKRLYENGARIIVNHDLDSVEKNDVIISNTFNYKKRRIKNVDILIYAGRSRSENKLYRKLKRKNPKVFATGDSVAPRLIEQVIFESEQLARSI